MTNDEWKSVAACIAGYFPTMSERLTPEQTREWRKALDPCDPEQVKAAIGRWYQRDPTGAWPVLARIVEASRPVAQVAKGWKPAPDAKKQAAEEVRRQCEIGRQMLAERKRMREQQTQGQTS